MIADCFRFSLCDSHASLARNAAQLASHGSGRRFRDGILSADPSQPSDRSRPCACRLAARAGGALVAGIWAPQVPFLTAPLWIVVLTPVLLKQFAQRRQISLAKRRMGQSRWKSLLVVASLLVWLSLVYSPLWASRLVTKWGGFADPTSVLVHMLTLPLLAAACLPVIFWLSRGQKNQKLRQKVAAAVQMHDFRRVLEIGRSASRAVARDPLLRYQMAFSRAVTGDCPGAIAEFERLWRDHPRLPLTALSLTSLLLAADQAERRSPSPRALSVACRTTRQPTCWLPARSADSDVWTSPAKPAAERWRPIRGVGAAQAIGALISLDAGDLLQAQQAIARGLELSPGEPYVLLCRGEIALKTQPLSNCASGRRRGTGEYPRKSVRVLPRRHRAAPTGPLRFGMPVAGLGTRHRGRLCHHVASDDQ